MQLNCLSSTEELDAVLDEDKYIAIVNSSGWPGTKVITLTNKTEFVNCLVWQQIVSSREEAVIAFGHGLELVGLHTLIRRNWKELKQLFVKTEEQKLSANNFFEAYSQSTPK